MVYLKSDSLWACVWLDYLYTKYIMYGVKHNCIVNVHCCIATIVAPGSYLHAQKFIIEISTLKIYPRSPVDMT